MPRLNSAIRLPRHPGQQRGVIMLFTLITLVLLLLSTMALIRSFDTSLLLAGNLGFKRDLANKGERGMAAAIALFKKTGTPGALAMSTSREKDNVDINYSASMLTSNPANHGIPDALIGDSNFATNSVSGSKPFKALDIIDTDGGVTTATIRYVVDRLCQSSGSSSPAGAFSADTCVTVDQPATQGGSSWLANKKVGQEVRPVYRVTVRVKGPRNTEAYLQSTFSV